MGVELVLFFSANFTVLSSDELYADKEKLERLLSNLLVNAIKNCVASPERAVRVLVDVVGGEIESSSVTGEVGRSMSEVEVSRSPLVYQIRVLNTGCGLSQVPCICPLLSPHPHRFSLLLRRNTTNFSSTTITSCLRTVSSTVALV